MWKRVGLFSYPSFTCKNNVSSLRFQYLKNSPKCGNLLVTRCFSDGPNDSKSNFPKYTTQNSEENSRTTMYPLHEVEKNDEWFQQRTKQLEEEIRLRAVELEVESALSDNLESNEPRKPQPYAKLKQQVLGTTHYMLLLARKFAYEPENEMIRTGLLEGAKKVANLMSGSAFQEKKVNLTVQDYANLIKEFNTPEGKRILTTPNSKISEVQHPPAREKKEKKPKPPKEEVNSEEIAQKEAQKLKENAKNVLKKMRGKAKAASSKSRKEKSDKASNATAETKKTRQTKSKEKKK